MSKNNYTLNVSNLAVMNTVMFTVSVVEFQMFQQILVMMAFVFFFRLKTNIGVMKFVFVS